jgi:uncharacterized membrane protein
MEKTIVTILGVVFIAVGLLGFVNNPVLGIFAVDTLHNVIHLLSGALALWAVNKGMGAVTTFAKVFGIVYGLVAILGFLMGSPILGLVTVNMADNVLHIVLAVVFLYIGFGGKSESEM